MAKRAGGYKRSDPTEWAECARSSYGEAITSANRLGQDVYTWMNDAIAHHVYRVEQIEAQQRYQADEVTAARNNDPTPDKNDPRYQVTRPKPTITEPGAGKGSTTGRSYRR